MSFDNIYELCSWIIIIPASVFLFIMFRNYLGLRPFNFEKRSAKWCVEGLAMKRNILLPVLKDILINIIGVAYIAITLYFALSFSIKALADYFVYDYFSFGKQLKYFFQFLLLSPIIIRLIFEVAIFVAPMIINIFICFGMFLVNRIRYYISENNKHIAKQENE